MNNNVKLIFTFVLGAAAGSAVTWKLLKTKYERIAQEEIDSVKEVYSRGHRVETGVIDEAVPEEATDEITEEVMYTSDSGEPITSRKVQASDSEKMEYSSISGLYKQEEKGGSDNMIFPKPYVISANEFEDGSDFDKVYLNYYADDILTDDFGEVISDIDDVIGVESLEHFENSDVIYVRNERLMRDYEVCLDNARFSELNLVDDE